MSVYLLLTACAVGADAAPLPPPGRPAQFAAGYATATDAPMQAPAWPAYPAYGYPVVNYPAVMPMQPYQPYWPIVPVAGCSGGNCGGGGCASGGCAAPSCAGPCPTCDDYCGKRRLFNCFRHKRDCCEMPCGQPDYKAVADSCCPKKCGLFSRLRSCFKKDCCKPSLKDRLHNCFHKNDCCEEKPTCCKPKADCCKPKDDCCCKPSLHDRLRACFHKRKHNDCCNTCNSCGSTGAPPMGQPEPIKPPKEMPKDGKEAAGPLVPLPRGPATNITTEVPF